MSDRTPGGPVEDAALRDAYAALRRADAEQTPALDETWRAALARAGARRRARRRTLVAGGLAAAAAVAGALGAREMVVGETALERGVVVGLADPEPLAFLLAAVPGSVITTPSFDATASIESRRGERR